jgi:hemerythrin-like domain-containing protein
MTEEAQAPKSVSEMVRITAENQQVFLTQIAEHVDKLENALVQLQNRIVELEKANVNTDQAQ